MREYVGANSPKGREFLLGLGDVDGITERVEWLHIDRESGRPKIYPASTE